MLSDNSTDEVVEEWHAEKNIVAQSVVNAQMRKELDIVISFLCKDKDN